jgi:hypothetical protein
MHRFLSVGLPALVLAFVSSQAFAGEKCTQVNGYGVYSEVLDRYLGTVDVNFSGSDGKTVDWQCFFVNSAGIRSVSTTMFGSDGTTEAPYILQNVDINTVYYSGQTIVTSRFMLRKDAKPLTTAKLKFDVNFYPASLQNSRSREPDEFGVIGPGAPLKGPILIRRVGWAGDPAKGEPTGRWLTHSKLGWIAIDSWKGDYYLPLGQCLGWREDFSKNFVLYAGIRLGKADDAPCPQ